MTQTKTIFVKMLDPQGTNCPTCHVRVVGRNRVRRLACLGVHGGQVSQQILGICCDKCEGRITDPLWKRHEIVFEDEEGVKK